MTDEKQAGSPENLGGGAASLLDQHKELSTGGKASRGPRGPYRKTRERGAAPAAGPAPAGTPVVPPAAALPNLMASATGLFFATHAAMFDDEDWLVGDAAKKEMGDILSWMLADDFYKIGGVGKYVTGTVLFLGLYSMQAFKTAGKRRARINEARRRAGLPPLPGSVRPVAPGTAVAPPAAPAPAQPPIPQAPETPRAAPPAEMPVIGPQREQGVVDISPGKFGPLVAPPDGFEAPEPPPQA